MSGLGAGSLLCGWRILSGGDKPLGPLWHFASFMPCRPWVPDPSQRRRPSQYRRRLTRLTRILADKVVRKADIQRFHTLQILNLLVRQPNTKRLHVVLQVLDLAPADDGEYMRVLVQHICERDRRRRLEAMLCRDFA